MLKKVLITSAFCVVSAAANADGLPAAANYAPASIGNWNGLYAGIQSGIAVSHSDITGNDGEGFSGPDGAPRQGLAGAYVGYDRMMNDMLVVGVLADMNSRFGSDEGGTTDGPAIPTGWRTGSDWNASIRGRVGVPAGQALFYTTGGVAFANYKLDNPACIGCSDWGTDNLLGGTRMGWTAGAGVEVKLDENWRAKLEYLHADFGSHDYTSGSVATKSDITSDAVQFGLAYQFN